MLQNCAPETCTIFVNQCRPSTFNQKEKKNSESLSLHATRQQGNKKKTNIISVVLNRPTLAGDLKLQLSVNKKIEKLITPFFFGTECSVLLEPLLRLKHLHIFKIVLKI